MLAETPPAARSLPAAAAPAVIPALTPVKIEIIEQMASKISQRGSSFPLRLAAPIVVDGATVVPAGTPGVGEVVESKGGGMSGSAGVLILAARYLTIDGRQLRLRSMHLNPTGADNIATATAVGVAVGIVGLFVTGGKVVVPSGTIADAKTAEDFALGPATANSTTPTTTVITATTTTASDPQLAAAPAPTKSNGGNSQ